MDSLVACGTGAALLYSLWNTLEISLGVQPVARAMDLYFESAGMLVAMISLGKYFEARSKLKTTDAITALMQLRPQKTCVIRDGKEVLVRPEELVAGDLVRVRPAIFKTAASPRETKSGTAYEAKYRYFQYRNHG